MDLQISKLFNDGSNDGDMTIICSGGEKINCHSFVLCNQSEFFKASYNFTKLNSGTNSQMNKTITFEFYPLKVVTVVVNKMYSSTYKIPNITIDEMLTMIKMMDEILVTGRENIVKEIIQLFEQLLSIDNWFMLLEKVFYDEMHYEFKTAILSYFHDVLLSDDEITIDHLFLGEINDPTIMKSLMELSLSRIKQERGVKTKYNNSDYKNSKPKSEYQEFITNEIKRLRRNNLSLSNRALMIQAAAAWTRHKKEKIHKPTKKIYDSEEEVVEEEEEEVEEIPYKGGQKKSAKIEEDEQ